MFSNIPDEMKQYKQWITWKYEIECEGDNCKYTKIPYSPLTGSYASVSDPSTWVSFEEALSVVSYYSGLGFVLSIDDPFTFIDLDEPKGHLTAEEKQVITDRQIKIYQEFNSYSEVSPSGKGLHIIVKGKVASGRKRSSIEIYSDKRFMTMTGNVYNPVDIQDKQVLLSILWEQMASGSTSAVCYAGDDVERYKDDEIIQQALNAKNGDLFHTLLSGNWRDKYQSQSEADFAFINIVAYYTQNKNQIARIFRNSFLGNSPKGIYKHRGDRSDYVNKMILDSFDRMLPPVEIDQLRNMVEETIKLKAEENKKKRKEGKINSIEAKQNRDEKEASKNKIVSSNPYNHLPFNPSQNPYAFPPGLLGDVARYIYNSAPRPVQEIALAGAIGFMAGICGRVYNISGTGLNQYVLLLSSTGTGKEAISSGINKLIQAVQRTVPAASEFIGPAEIASPQALVKYMSKSSVCFMSLMGEVGLLFKQLTHYNANPNMIGLRRILLDLYNKSGEGNVLRPTIYSDREKNTEPLYSPSFTMLGETTPETFYTSLSEHLITEGLLPRFTVIEYEGLRVPINKNHLTVVPSFQLIEQLSALVAHCLTNIHANKVTQVIVSDEAAFIFDAFDVYCDKQINSNNMELIKHLWNRAHIKALKLAALVSVGIDPYNTVISKDAAEWSINIIIADVNRMLRKFELGEIGEDTEETNQISEVRKAIKEYCTREYNDIEKYKSTTRQIHDDKVITLSFIHRRLAAMACFRKDKIGATRALQRSIDALKDQGDLYEIPVRQLVERYNYTGKCFAIVRPKRFNLEG